VLCVAIAFAANSCGRDASIPSPLPSVRSLKVGAVETHEVHFDADGERVSASLSVKAEEVKRFPFTSKIDAAMVSGPGFFVLFIGPVRAGLGVPAEVTRSSDALREWASARLPDCLGGDDSEARGAVLRLVLEAVRRVPQTDLSGPNPLQLTDVGHVLASEMCFADEGTPGGALTGTEREALKKLRAAAETRRLERGRRLHGIMHHDGRIAVVYKLAAKGSSHRAEVWDLADDRFWIFEVDADTPERTDSLIWDCFLNTTFAR